MALSVKDANGANQNVETLPAKGAALAAASLPVVLATDAPVDTVVKATATSRSGAIATAGQSQVFAPADPNRRGFVVQNQSAGDLWIGTSPATMDNACIRIPAGALYESASHHVGTAALGIIGATLGQSFYGRTF